MFLVSLWHMPRSVKIRIWVGSGIGWIWPTLRPFDLPVDPCGLACGLMAQPGTSTRMELEKPLGKYEEAAASQCGGSQKRRDTEVFTSARLPRPWLSIRADTDQQLPLSIGSNHHCSR